MPASQLFRRIIHATRTPCGSSISSSSPRWVLPSINRHHILATDYTPSTAKTINLLLRRIRVSRVHITGSAAIFDEIEALGRESAEGEVERDDMIDGEDTREEEDGVEECSVNDELDPVCGLGISRCHGSTSRGTYSKSGRRRMSTCSCHPTAVRHLCLPL